MRGKLSYLTYTILSKLFKLCKNSDILIGGLDTAVNQSSLSRSVAQPRLNLCNCMHCSTTGFPVLHHLLELCQTHGRWAGNAIKQSHPVIPISSYLQSFPASGSFLTSWLFAWGGQGIGASASASRYSGLISFRIDWFDLLAVQGALKSLF